MKCLGLDATNLVIFILKNGAKSLKLTQKVFFFLFWKKICQKNPLVKILELNKKFKLLLTLQHMEWIQYDIFQVSITLLTFLTEQLDHIPKTL
jgi:hypothetical protein